MIVPIGEWVVREACRMAATLPASVKIAVNVSTVQFNSSGFLSTVASAMNEAGVDGSRMVVEITESIMIKEAEQTIAILHELRDLGIAIAMDDFGTGYSSLSYLRKFPFDKVKIDQSFVGGLGADDSAADIVRAAVALAARSAWCRSPKASRQRIRCRFLSRPVARRRKVISSADRCRRAMSTRFSAKRAASLRPDAASVPQNAADRRPRDSRTRRSRGVTHGRHGRRNCAMSLESVQPRLPNATPAYVSKTLN